ncbi:unnamed protein product [Ixodes persulcatus]
MMRGTASNMGGIILITNTGLMWLCCCLFAVLIAVSFPLAAILEVYGCDSFQHQNYSNLDQQELTKLRESIGTKGPRIAWTKFINPTQLELVQKNAIHFRDAAQSPAYIQLNRNVGNCKVAQRMSQSIFLVSCNILAENMSGLWLSMLCCLVTMCVTMPVSFSISRYFFRVKRYLVDGKPPDEK